MQRIVFDASYLAASVSAMAAWVRPCWRIGWWPRTRADPDAAECRRHRRRFSMRRRNGRAWRFLCRAHCRSGLSRDPGISRSANRGFRHFDQVRFYPVSAGELLRLRRDFLTGRFQFRVERGSFDLAITSTSRTMLKNDRRSSSQTTRMAGEHGDVDRARMWPAPKLELRSWSLKSNCPQMAVSFPRIYPAMSGRSWPGKETG